MAHKQLIVVVTIIYNHAEMTESELLFRLTIFVVLFIFLHSCISPSSLRNEVDLVPLACEDEGAKEKWYFF